MNELHSRMIDDDVLVDVPLSRFRFQGSSMFDPGKYCDTRLGQLFTDPEPPSWFFRTVDNSTGPPGHQTSSFTS